MGNQSEAKRPDELRAIARELEAMSDWELERWPEVGVALWILAIAAGAGVIALLE